MGKKCGYLAGALFNEAEVNQRKLEGKKLREQTTINWYNPIEAPINDKATLPTASDIFWGDTREVLKSDYVIADLTNNDVGTAYELGIA
jgi:nucleoside 2-deoxyribosyltransferase